MSGSPHLIPAFAAACLLGVAGLASAQTCGEPVWRQVDNAGPPGGGSGCVTVYLAAQKGVLLFGGVINDARTDQTWFWDGQTWDRRPTLGGIPGLWGAAATYDSLRNRVVLCSGGTWSGGYNADTWEYDGERWHLVASDGPGFRNHVWQIAFDARRGKTVLFGGADPIGTVHYNDTWEWDGSAWSRVATTGPSPRSGHAMAFDQRRGVTVLYGGGDAYHTFADTWEWDGSAWALRPAQGPSMSGQVRLAYDSQRERIVACGADILSSSPRFETWEWDGQAWTRLPIRSSPQPRILHNVAYDADRQCLVLFGGVNRLTGFSDTWELDRLTTPPTISLQPAALTLKADAGTAVLRLEADGDIPIRYQWFKDDQPVQDSDRFLGSHSPVLSISKPTPADAGAYHCVLTNACGSVQSQLAVLTVTATEPPSHSPDDASR